MRAYLQRSGHHRKRSGSSHFNEENGPRTERIAHASGVGFGGTILGDFMNTAPPMLYGLSIIGAETCFPLSRAGTTLSNMDHANTTHVSLLTLLELFLLYFLSDSFSLHAPIATA